MPSGKRNDFSWRRSNVLAILGLCLLAGAGLALKASQDTLVVGDSIEVDGARVQQGIDRVDPNTAGLPALRRLPEIGSALAERIIDYRRAAHAARPFASADDLAKVPGIGVATVEAIRPYLRFDQHAGL